MDRNAADYDRYHAGSDIDDSEPRSLCDRQEDCYYHQFGGPRTVACGTDQYIGYGSQHLGASQMKTVEQLHEAISLKFERAKRDYLSNKDRVSEREEAYLRGWFDAMLVAYGLSFEAARKP